MEPKTNNKKIKIFLIVFIVIVAVALVTTSLIYFLRDRAKANDQIADNTVEIEENNDVTDQPQVERNLQQEATTLKESYTDVIGWLKISGTNIDTPIFQSKDNDRYLRHDRDNNNTKWGETFLDYRCDINNIDNMSHFILYGHNTETDDHFTPLLNYKSQEFYNQNKVIEMSTINGNYKWEIFAAYVTNTDFYYIETDFKDKAAYGEFINSLKAKSLYDTGVTVTQDDTILTLSTCEYSQANGRFVVQAKLIK